MSDLKISTERVQEAAKSCPDAKPVLEKLFPEAFETPLRGYRGSFYCGKMSGYYYVIALVKDMYHLISLEKSCITYSGDQNCSSSSIDGLLRKIEKGGIKIRYIGDYAAFLKHVRC